MHTCSNDLSSRASGPSARHTAIAQPQRAGLTGGRATHSGPFTCRRGLCIAATLKYTTLGYFAQLTTILGTLRPAKTSIPEPAASSTWPHLAHTELPLSSVHLSPYPVLGNMVRIMAIMFSLKCLLCNKICSPLFH